MRSIIAATVMSLTASLSNCAKADCDTGFDMQTLPNRAYEDEVVFFKCVIGGYYGDPDFGLSMVHLLSTDGAEIRAHVQDVADLRKAGVVR